MDTRTHTEIDADVADFLQRKAALEILVRIGTETTQRHTDLREELLVSSSTLQRRLKTGVKLGLFDQRLEPRGEVNAKVYVLTSQGKALHQRAEEEGLVGLCQFRREVVRSLRDRKQKIVSQ